MITPASIAVVLFLTLAASVLLSLPVFMALDWYNRTRPYTGKMWQTTTDPKTGVQMAYGVLPFETNPYVDPLTESWAPLHNPHVPSEPIVPMHNYYDGKQ